MSKAVLPMFVLVVLVLSNQNKTLYLLTQNKVYETASNIFLVLAAVFTIVEIILLIK